MNADSAVPNCWWPGTLSGEALRSLQDRDWSRQPATCLLWGLLAILFAQIVLGRVLDRRRRRKGIWRSESFMTTDPVYSTRHRMFIASARGHRDPSPSGCCARARVRVIGCCARVRVDAACMGIRLCLSRRLRFRSDDLKLILAGLSINTRLESDARLQKSDYSWDACDEANAKDVGHGVSTAVKDLAVALRLPEGLQQAEGAYERATCLRKAARLFIAVHPWMALTYLSITATCRLRSLFYAVEFLGALALEALYLSAREAVLSHRSDASCVSPKMMDVLPETIAIGVGSRAVSWIVARAVLRLRQRYFVHNVNWNRPLKVRRIVDCWKRKDAFVSFLGLSCICVCTLYLIVFLADSRDRDRATWLAGASTVLLLDAVVLPAMAGLTLTILGGCCMRAQSKQELHRRAHERMAMISFEAPAAPPDGKFPMTIPETRPAVLTLAAPVYSGILLPNRPQGQPSSDSKDGPALEPQMAKPRLVRADSGNLQPADPGDTANSMPLPNPNLNFSLEHQRSPRGHQRSPRGNQRSPRGHSKFAL